MKKILAIALLTGAALAAAPADARGFHGPHVGVRFGFGAPGCWGCGYYPPYYGPAYYPPYYAPYPPPPPPYYRPYNEGAVHVSRRPAETDYELPDSVLFALDSAEISKDADAIIHQIADAMRSEPRATLIVEGHTDTSGDRAHNQQLSQARAQAVRSVLVRQGVPADRIQSEGLGENGLAVQTGPDVREQRNRRVVVRLMHNQGAARQIDRDDRYSDDQR